MKFKKWFYSNEAADESGGAASASAGAGAAGGSASITATGGGGAAGDVGKGNGDAGPAATDWPDDWRTRISGDPSHAKTLQRFASPKAVFESYTALRQRLDNGEFKSAAPYPDKGTPEEQKAWRTERGIPEKPEDYSLKFGDGLVIGDADKPIVDDFLKVAHTSNIPPENVNAMLHWYYDNQEKQLDLQEEKDTNFLAASEDALRAEWGGDFRGNINRITNLVGTLPDAVRDLFVSARLANGDAMINHPDVARWLVQIDRTINPTPTIMPGAGANAAGHDDEIASIEKVMRENRKAYNKDEKMQARYRELLTWRERAKK